MTKTASSVEASPIGYFNFADSYSVAAKRLASTKFRTTHPDSPTRLLFHFALELYLKAFLLLKRANLESIHGHGLVKLGNRANKLGISLPTESSQMFQYFDALNTVIVSRYFRSRYIIGGEPSLEEIDRACDALRVEVAKHFRSSGNAIGRLRIVWKEKT